MFSNLKFVWKFSILTAIIPIAAIIVSVIGTLGAGSLKSQYDNLYGFMLIPIYNIEEANVDLKNLAADFTALNNSSPTDPGRAALVDGIRSADKAMVDIMTRYDNEWLSTTSADFTATLAAMGKSSLQTDEVNALKQYHDAYTTYSAQRDAALSSNAPVTDALASSITQMETGINKLVEVNMLFADLSNTSAQDTISQMRWQLIAAGLLVSILGIGFSLLLTRSVVKPLALITETASNLSMGNLSRNISEESQNRVNRAKDEIGTVGKSLTGARLYITGIAEAASRIADGDLTVDVQPKSSQDELGIAFANMISRLREMVNGIAENAASLNAASGQLASAASQAGQATSQIATTVQQVAKGSAQQSESVSRTAASVEQVSKAIDGVSSGAQKQAAAVEVAASVTSQITSTIQQVASSAQAVSRDSAGASDAAKNGAHTVQDTIAGMQSIKAKVGLSAQKVQEMGRRSDQIGAIVETIDDIASQTNLLALNAAIEAARAGEHGKGFAVVADEVRKLAERSSVATKEIGSLIKGIQQTVSEAVAAMDDGAREVENGVVKANSAGDALSSILRAAEAVYQQAEQVTQASSRMSKASNELVGAMDAVSTVVEENASATRQMAAGAEEVTQSIENIASVSEENSAAIEEVSASAEEMSAQVEEVTASAQSLAEMAQALQQVVDQFKLSDQAQSQKRNAQPGRASEGPVTGFLPAQKKNGHYSTQDLPKAA